jgi:hypothetical protein
MYSTTDPREKQEQEQEVSRNPENENPDRRADEEEMMKEDIDTGEDNASYHNEDAD